MKTYYFSANWCGPCKAFKPTVQQLQNELKIPIQYEDVEQSVYLVERFQIKSIPTIIITDDLGNEKFRHSGIMSRDSLLSVFNSFK